MYIHIQYNIHIYIYREREHDHLTNCRGQRRHGGAAVQDPFPGGQMGRWTDIPSAADGPWKVICQDWD